METKLLSKTILLVDDDPVFLKGMMYTVKQLGYNSVLATSGREAAEKVKLQEVDAIVSDINMPNGNGLQLLNHIKKHAAHIPVILMTGVSDLKEAQAAIDMGAKSFLSKPFKKADLHEVLENSFSKIESVPDFVPETQMIKLHIEEFLHGQMLNFSIFFKNKGSFVKISSGGENLTPETVNSHRDAGIDFLYVNKKEFIDHLGLRGFTSNVTSCERKAFIRDSAFKVLTELDYLSDLNKDAFTRGQVHLESTLDILTDNEDTLSLLEKMTKCKSNLFKRSVEVAFFSVLISQYLGNISTHEYFTLTAGGLFHDVGLIDTSIDVTNDPLDSLSPNERVIMEMHPERGVKILSKISQLPGDIRLIVEQHHENEIGTGYPNALTARFINPLAKVAIVASAFTFLLIDKALTIEEAHTLLDEFSVASKDIYSMKSLEALLLVFNRSMPEEFVEYQLARMLSPVENL